MRAEWTSSGTPRCRIALPEVGHAVRDPSHGPWSCRHAKEECALKDATGNGGSLAERVDLPRSTV